MNLLKLLVKILWFSMDISRWKLQFLFQSSFPYFDQDDIEITMRHIKFYLIEGTLINNK